MLVSNFLTDVDLVTSNPPFDPREKLDLAHRELTGIIYPKLRQDNDGYFMRKVSVVVEKGVDSFPLPPRSFSSAAVEVKLRRDNTLINLTKVNPSQIDCLKMGTPQYFYHMRNRIVLWPAPSSQMELVVWYEVQPSKLVLETDGREISDISGDELTILPRPTEFLHSLYDVVNVDTGDYESLGVSATKNGDVYTSTEWSPDIKVGDYIFKSGETGILPIPEAYQFALTELTSAALLRGLGDYNAAKDRRSIGMELLNNISPIVTRTTEENHLYDNEWL